MLVRVRVDSVLGYRDSQVSIEQHRDELRRELKTEHVPFFALVRALRELGM